MSFQWAPAAFAQNFVGCHFPRGIGAYQHKVCPVTFTDIAALVDVVDLCGSMAHFFNDGLESEYSLIYQLQHADKRKLYHRHAGHGFQSTPFFLGEQMGGMVGGYNVYQAGVDGCTQGIAVGLLLNGRITLDTCTQRAIVTEREEEMGNACFGGDMLLGK